MPVTLLHYSLPICIFLFFYSNIVQSVQKALLDRVQNGLIPYTCTYIFILKALKK